MQTTLAKFDYRRSLRLAAVDGARLEAAAIPSWDEPEAEMHVSFEGLSDAEQRAALAAFPGGRRFRLVSLS